MAQPTDPAAIFATNRATLNAIVAQLRAALDSDPDAARGQADRLNAWCQATAQFLDPGYWSAALDVHLAAQRAAQADAQHRQAATDAAVRKAAREAAQRDADERAAHLALTHPRKL